MQDELFDILPPNALQQWPPQPLSDPVWQRLWTEFAGSEAGLGLDVFLRQSLKKGAVVFPADPLRALRLTPFDQVRVLIWAKIPTMAQVSPMDWLFPWRPAPALRPACDTSCKSGPATSGLRPAQARRTI